MNVAQHCPKPACQAKTAISTVRMLASWSNQPARVAGEARAANTTIASSPEHLLCAAVDAGLGRRVLACRCAVIRERRRRALCLPLDQRQLCRGNIEWQTCCAGALHALCHAADDVGNARTAVLGTAQELAWRTAAGTSCVTYSKDDQAGGPTHPRQ